MNRLFALITMVCVAFSAQAQTTSAANTSVWDDPTVLFYVTAGFLFVVSILVIVVALYMLQVLKYMARNAAIEKAEKLGVAYKEEPSFWSRLTQMANQSVPLEKEETIMLDHNYDGIRELDNHLPPWWKWLLYGSIVWAAVYLIAYHVTNSLPLSIAEYDNEVAYAQEELNKLQAASPGVKIDENSVVFTTDAAALNDGKQTFNSICASCHRPDGGGDIGPNLTDEYWKHGGDIKDLFKVVTNGVPSTNMVAWGASLSPEKIQNVASYVLTLQGTNPSNAKPPEGDLYKPPVKEEAAQDSIKAQASL